MLSGPNKSLIATIDAWENVWFDVVDAALGRHSPEVRDKVLKNLGKTSGPMVVLNVKALLDRLDELKASSNSEEQAALALLQKRGLDEQQRAYARGLVDQARTELGDPEEATLPQPSQEVAALQAAVDQMWAWYLDWSKTARTVVKDKRLRIIMGISSATRTASGTSLDDETPAAGASPTSPAPTTA